MAANLVRVLQKKLLDHLLNGAAYTQPVSLLLSLHSTPGPGETGSTANEITLGGYARTAVVFDTAAAAASPYLIDNTGSVVFGPASADYDAQVTHIGIHDVAGEMLAYGALTTPRTVLNGDTLTFAIGDIDISID